MYGTYSRLNLHVSASWRDVIRASSTRLMAQARFSKAQRRQRHAFYRQMLDYHRNAQEIVRFWRL